MLIVGTDTNLCKAWQQRTLHAYKSHIIPLQLLFTCILGFFKYSRYFTVNHTTLDSDSGIIIVFYLIKANIVFLLLQVALI